MTHCVQINGPITVWFFKLIIKTTWVLPNETANEHEHPPNWKGKSRPIIIDVYCQRNPKLKYRLNRNLLSSHYKSPYVLEFSTWNLFTPYLEKNWKKPFWLFYRISCLNLAEDSVSWPGKKAHCQEQNRHYISTGIFTTTCCAALC